MTPRRYFPSTLTVDNRDLASQAESLTDEVHALRRSRHELLMLLVGVVAVYANQREEIAALTAQRDELAELVKVRDEQLAELRARGWERL